MTTRLISHSQASTALDCEVKHDFAYVGHLAGSALKPKVEHINLRDGRAWGRGVQAWSAAAGQVDAVEQGRAAIVEALDEDAERQREAGLFLEDAYTEQLALLLELFDHQVTLVDPLRYVETERELVVPIPSRGGRRKSSLYRLQAFIDGVAEDEHGQWIVEDKLRGNLSSLDQIAKSRQLRWYAWAWREATGVAPAGIIVRERLKAAPKPVKLNKNESVSKVQSCTPEAYIEAHATAGTEPDEEVLEKLRAKRWHLAETIFLTSAEIDEAGMQLTSVARRLRDLHSGTAFPVRNPSPMRCPGCAFRDICVEPGNTELVDALFNRKGPKWGKTQKEKT